MTQLTANITQGIIDNADQESFGNCMVAMGLRERGCTQIHVTSQRALFTFDEVRYSADMPIKAMQAITAFDENKRLVRPFKAVFRDLAVKPRHKGTSRAGLPKTASKKRGKVCIRRWRGLKTLWKDGVRVG